MIRLLNLCVWTMLPFLTPVVLAEAQDPASANDNSTMGAFVLDKIDAGLDGQALADAIQQHISDAKKKEGDGAAEKQHGQGHGAHGRHHGLAAADVEGLGKFVTAQIAAGVHGKDLAEAIHKELEKIKGKHDKGDGDGQDGGQNNGNGDNGNGNGNGNSNGHGKRGHGH